MPNVDKRTDTPSMTSSPPVIWHEYYNDPAHELVLVSRDNVHFRISKFVLARGGNSLVKAGAAVEAIIKDFASFHSWTIEVYLDLCCGRIGYIPGHILDDHMKELYNLLEQMGRVVQKPTSVDSRTPFLAGLMSSLLGAQARNDHIVAAKCLRHLGLANPTPGRLLKACGPEWQTILIDILFDNYQPSDLPLRGLEGEQARRMRWLSLADKFESKVSDIKAAATATTNAKRSAENGTEAPAAKTRKTGPDDS